MWRKIILDELFFFFFFFKLLHFNQGSIQNAFSLCHLIHILRSAIAKPSLFMLPFVVILHAFDLASCRLSHVEIFLSSRHTIRFLGVCTHPLPCMNTGAGTLRMPILNTEGLHGD